MITLVTGNPHKLAELQAMAPAGLAFRHEAIDLVEPQTLDLHEIVDYKVRRAFEAIKQPVIIEDVAAGLESLNGLPGPFIKFFEQELGRGAMYRLSKVENDRFTVRCLAAYYDGDEILYGEGTLRGTIVPPRGEHGFGFDCCVVPDGHDKTLAELETTAKNDLSHRGQAFRALLEQLA